MIDFSGLGKLQITRVKERITRICTGIFRPLPYFWDQNSQPYQDWICQKNW